MTPPSPSARKNCRGHDSWRCWGSPVPRTPREKRERRRQAARLGHAGRPRRGRPPPLRTLARQASSENRQPRSGVEAEFQGWPRTFPTSSLHAPPFPARLALEFPAVSLAPGGRGRVVVIDFWDVELDRKRKRETEIAVRSGRGVLLALWRGKGFRLFQIIRE